MKLDDINFSNLDEFEASMSDELTILWDEFQKDAENGFDYPDLENWLKKFKPYGLTFDYYLDAEPYDFEIKQ